MACVAKQAARCSEKEADQKMGSFRIAEASIWQIMPIKTKRETATKDVNK